ncbi:MAG: 16S rRNA (guanine(527)-N(7))-methyltransferase RsmG [Roseitalea porphyridii]|uniref:16S rRNA (guanine(527)-N(7))-methyltransferase RsmG n=1 Tax=Roseitalea porphyridii TaxID=1852022 RepID=UPI0032EDACB2
MSARSIQAALPADVSRETLERLHRFETLFRDWSRRINLVAASTEDDFWTRHIADSAQLLTLAPDARHWADLGSGGGFPGMVVAILMSEAADARVDLIESNRKKAAFLQTARAQCAPAARVHAERIEAVVPSIPRPEIVTARALAPLPDLFELAAPWMTAGTRALFHKGRGYAAELEECRAHWEFDLVEHPSRVAAGSVILDLTAVRRRGSG